MVSPASRSRTSAAWRQGGGDPRSVVPARAECRLCRVHRGLPDEEAGHLPHSVGTGLPQRPHGSRPCHHELLPHDPDLRLVEREVVDLQQGDYEEMDSSRLPSRCARPPSACCTRRTSASAWPAPSARRFRAVQAASISTAGQAVRPVIERRSRQEVAGEGESTRRPRRSRSRCSQTRASMCSRVPSRPLIILGKGAAYAQADAAIRASSEERIPFLPMSMGKGLCRHASAVRRRGTLTVLKTATSSC